MTKLTATYIAKNQDQNAESTSYWFTLNGTDEDTGVEFKGDIYALAESEFGSSVLDSEGYPVTEGDAIEIAVLKNCIITDEMRVE
jgi:hypothetical protein